MKPLRSGFMLVALELAAGCGTEPMAPRELLPLALPRDAEAAAEAATAAVDAEDEAERTSLDPFQRGPEITEVR